MEIKNGDRFTLVMSYIQMCQLLYVSGLLSSRLWTGYDSVKMLHKNKTTVSNKE